MKSCQCVAIDTAYRTEPGSLHCSSGTSNRVQLMDVLCEWMSITTATAGQQQRCYFVERVVVEECKNILQPNARIELAASRLKACHSTTELIGQLAAFVSPSGRSERRGP